MVRRISDERRPVVLDMYVNQQKSAVVIARETGFSKSAIYRILKATGISPATLRDSGERRGHQGGYRRFASEVERQIVADYQSGLGYHALAEKYDASVPTIRRCLRRQNQLPRRRGGMGKHIDPVLGEHLVADWHRGMSQHALGLKYNMHQTTVSNVLRRLHIEPEQRPLFGPDHSQWKGGRVLMNNYAYIRLAPQHPWYARMCTINGYVSEHRLVMAESLGRCLEEQETVHHINGDRTEPIHDGLVSKADVALLWQVVRARFLNLDAQESNAIVLALEGLQWLLDEDSAVTRASLEHERSYWEQHSTVPL